MKIETAWVSPPQSIGGLDHLGTQVPCVLIYGQLLPGITNVTDRARYYSLYPWLIWSFDQRYAKDDLAKFIEYFRRGDCLLTLISERHSRKTDKDNERHGGAMVGRNQLTQALDRLKKGIPLTLSEYTAQASPFRYFMSPMGGLSQYYAGTLSDLKLVDASAKPWIRYTKEFGAPLAVQVNASVQADLFWAVVENDAVTLDELDSLHTFCACQLNVSTNERKTLTDLYFDRNNEFEQDGQQRKHSLGMILNLVQRLPAGADLSEQVFRACIYSGALPGGKKWDIPYSLNSTLACWSIYQRNDLLSVTCQTILGLALRELEPQESVKKLVHGSIESFAEVFSSSSVVEAACKKLKFDTFGAYIDQLRANAPPITAWESDAHEIQLANRMMSVWGKSDQAEQLVEIAISLLALLACRDDLSQSPYGNVAMSPDALTDYPIQLVSFRLRVESWRTMTLDAVFADLVRWCLNSHLRVALRKLRQTGRSTFHMRPTERGLEVVGEIPPPANTTPRFRQAVQILRDIGALSRDLSTPNRQTRLTDVGTGLLEVAIV